MQRTPYDFDVCSGPALAPPPQPQPATPPASLDPAPAPADRLNPP